MRHKLTGSLLLFAAATAAFPQTSSDPQTTQTLLTEIRQLRTDLQAAAATIQRVQIVMYRLQTQSGLLDRATQRLDQARAVCSQAESQQKVFASQIEQIESRRSNLQSAADQKQVDEQIANFKSMIQINASQAQQCQGELAEAESQYRTEQAKMDSFQDQLDKLDQVLARQMSK